MSDYSREESTTHVSCRKDGVLETFIELAPKILDCEGTLFVKLA